MAMRVRKWQVICKWPHGGVTSASFDTEDEAHDDAMFASMEAAVTGQHGVVFDLVNPGGEVVATFESGSSSDDAALH